MAHRRYNYKMLWTSINSKNTFGGEGGAPWVFPSGSELKNPPSSAGDAGDPGSISQSGRSSGGWHGNPLQDSYLENPMDRGVWWATVHGLTKSQT